MRLFLTLMTAVVLHGSAAAACPPAGLNAAALIELRESGWRVADAARRQAMAIALQDCMGDPDMLIREGFAFEALETWLRGQQIDAATLRTIRTTQLAQLKKPDPTGFARPQAALLLAEVVGMDNRKKFLTPAERMEIVKAGTAYLNAVRDYRAFDEKNGWRHGLHSAAFLLDVMYNEPGLSRGDQREMLIAVATQLAQPSMAKPSYFFHHREGEMMAALVEHLSRRKELTAEDWVEFEKSFYTPPADDSHEVLARQHNLRSFLFPFYMALMETGTPEAKARLLPMARRQLKELL